jgi:peroxiredoxin
VQQGRAGQKDTRGAEIGHDFAERTTFIVSPEGKVVATVGGMSAKSNVDKALEAVQAYAVSRGK